MDENERLVRGTWKNIGEYAYGGTTRYVYLPEVNKEFIGANEAAAWSAAAEFTRKRLEEIEQVQDEIELLHVMSVTRHANSIEIMKRILAREQAALDALKRGMK